MHLDPAVIARFSTLYEPDGDCWVWLGAKDRDGYGRMRIGDRRTMRAHRISYAIHHGDPGRMLVCHHCDNPSCVNPDHLFLGTALDNNRDRVSKGRSNNARPGGANQSAKLTDDQAAAIAARYRAGGVRQVDLANEYGVSKSAIQLLLSGKNWKGLGAPVEGMRHAPKRSLRRLTDEARSALIAEYLAGGISQTALAEKYGVSQGYVSQAVRAT